MATPMKSNIAPNHTNLHAWDEKMRRGHAGWMQRGFNYLLFGGFAVVVNLLVFSLVYSP